jgi:hypothetical protein
VTLFQKTKTSPVGAPVSRAGSERYLVARDLPGPPYFRAVEGRVVMHRDGTVGLPAATATALDVREGDRVHTGPLG